jgi:hypothetical protein
MSLKVPLSQVSANIQQLDNALTRATNGNGQTTTRALRVEAIASGGPVLKSAMDAMLKARQATPETRFKAAEVREMHAALHAAAVKTGAFEVNDKGQVDWSTPRVKNLPKEEQQLAQAVIDKVVKVMTVLDGVSAPAPRRPERQTPPPVAHHAGTAYSGGGSGS